MPESPTIAARQLLSPREMADAIGVSESSLKRWVDEGLVQAARTAGKHRRIPINEAIRFIRKTRSHVVRPEILGLDDLNQAVPTASPHTLDHALFDSLEKGHESAARGLVLHAYLNGMTLAEIADGPLRSAMTQIGDLWQHRPDGIFIEHRATDIAIQAVNQIRLLLETSADAPAAVGGAPAGDPYLLPSILAACVLVESGFHAINLGPNTPMESLVHAASHHHARLCWLSISANEITEMQRSEILSVADELESIDSLLIVGGRHVKAAAWLKHRNLRVGESMTELADLARARPQ